MGGTRWPPRSAAVRRSCIQAGLEYEVVGRDDGKPPRGESILQLFKGDSSTRPHLGTALPVAPPTGPWPVNRERRQLHSRLSLLPRGSQSPFGTDPVDRGGSPRGGTYSAAVCHRAPARGTCYHRIVRVGRVQHWLGAAKSGERLLLLCLSGWCPYAPRDGHQLHLVHATFRAALINVVHSKPL